MDSKFIDVLADNPSQVVRTVAAKNKNLSLGKMKQLLEDENYHVIERDYGKFDRRIELPTSVDMDSIKASCKNGVLVVRLPKLEEKEVEEIRVDLA